MDMSHVVAVISLLIREPPLQGCTLTDVQAAFLERPSADALIKAASHMSHYVDSRVLTKLDVSNLDALKIHLDIVRA
jgi:hypothetical protein